MVLIDGGSTHNFIDHAIVSMFGLPVIRDKKFEVMVANREKIECTGQCRGLTLTIQGYSVIADYYILPVTTCQLVLGVQWLETLGPIEMDYKQLTMNFKVEGTPQTFQGLRRTSIEALSDKESNGLQGTGLFFQIIPSTTTNSQPKSYPPEIGQLLAKFSHVFESPTSLPLGRSHDHQIPLQSSAGPKADGDWHFCVDYRALNDITVKDKYPIPIIDELLEELHGAKFYSKLDLRSGYHQIRVHKDDIPKTAFRTHEGHYEFIVMPFGLTNAPVTFQSLMNDLFCSYLRKFILVFFDDILIYSRSWEDHLAHLQIVLQILSTNSLFAKESKCRFGVLQVEYLGHIISEQGVSVDPAKIQAIIEWPTPTTPKRVCGFLGLVGYYRKFIRHFGSIAAPLTRLLSKDGFQWNEAAEMAFTQLKEALTLPPILRLLNFTQRFVIECDASGIGLGAILTQENRPVAYYSQALKGSALSLSTYETEMLAIVKAIKLWRPYLLGKPFTVRTNQKSLKYLLEQRITTPAQTRWLPKLLGYDYEIEYKRGPENQGGHFGFHKTLSRIKQSFFLSNMRRMVKDFLQQCDICQRFKTDCMKPAGLLQPLPVPTQMWTDVSMDFIEGLPSSNGYTSIMVVVDRLTKYAHFVTLKHPFTAVIIAKAFVANVGTKLCMSSSYHPQSDGQTEVVNRTLEQYLQCFAGDQPRKWLEWIPWAEFSYNTSTHFSTKMTPFEAVYGIPHPRLLAYVPGTFHVQAVDEYLRDRDAILRELRYNLLLAQDRMKCQADQHRREASFLVGDYVYLKIQPYRQTSMAFRSSMKLAPCFFDPYKVIAKVGPVAYKLALPLGSQIHDVFHVSLLKKHLGPVTATSTQLPPVSDTSTVLPQPEAVLDRRVIHKGKYRPKSEILVKWVGVPAEDATWENEWRFTKSYPDFILVDKDP
ncbi:Retrovirus-related Pol polyprotein from transposon 17.6 [Vitis vinifera]|uniref:Retrovirus-related Pol polyprotein from transposon 17.6 n=1 Tax=Vitis vinifera TaxID=29760 RepID=A0A438GCU3_VITVI|nr:Retrovirus-related Pol polyprotein from transposon 17.6 [Vitis vinifera]